MGLGEGAGAGGGVGGDNGTGPMASTLDCRVGVSAHEAHGESVREGDRGAGWEMGVVLSSFAAPEKELEERLEEEAGVVSLPFPTLGEGLEEGLEGWKGICGEGDWALGATSVFFFFLLRLVFLFVFLAGGKGTGWHPCCLMDCCCSMEGHPCCSMGAAAKVSSQGSSKSVGSGIVLESAHLAQKYKPGTSANISRRRRPRIG